MTCKTHQFETPQGPIPFNEWFAWSLGRQLSEGLDKLDERAIRPGHDGQSRLVTDGGHDVQSAGETSQESETERCGACGDVATHEVLPPNPERDDYVGVCETHAEELRPISADVREIDADAERGESA